MVTFTSVLAALGGATIILANPINTENSLQNLITRATSTPPGRGTHDGFYYDFWTDNQGGQGSVNYTNEAGGKYTVTWSNTGNFVAGKGWSPGTWGNVSYSGTWNGSSGNSYISLYGWMENPLTEYYIMETFGTYDPGAAFSKPMANLTVDGATYHIYTTTRTQYVGGEPPFFTTQRQIWSVRQQRRVGGTINAQAHMDAWVEAGIKLGATHRFQILATEAYQYKNIGFASITVQGD